MSYRDEVHALAVIQGQVAAGEWRVSVHARREMKAEAITLGELREAIAAGQVIENYPDAQRGPCCLLYGTTTAGRPLHLVCTTARTPVVIITVYVPLPPKWLSPTERRPT